MEELERNASKAAYLSFATLILLSLYLALWGLYCSADAKADRKVQSRFDAIEAKLDAAFPPQSK